MPNNSISTEDIKVGILFAWVFILFIMTWISVAVVGRAIDNFVFSTLKLNDKSTYHTSIIAVAIVLIQLLTMYYFHTLGMDLYGTSFFNNGDESDTNEKTTKKSNTEFINRSWDDNDSHFLDNMQGISALSRIEGITII